MRVVNDFSLKIAGSAGSGILNAGLCMFAKSCQRAGLNVFSTAEYPSLIRGGHNHLDIRVSGEEVHSHSRQISLLLALDKFSVEKHSKRVAEGGGIIFDSDAAKDVKAPEGVRLYPVPLGRIAKECGAELMRNTVGIGAAFALAGMDINLLFSAIMDRFSGKGKGIVDSNIKAAEKGFEYVKEKFKDEFRFGLEALQPNGRIFISGNDALSIGAIKAGCKFYAAYPMTPASSILHTMAKYERDYKIVVKHTEDEIAAINMAIGAGFAGVRAMTGTSGGGFALMIEGVGLAAMTETPLVVVESMRPGPASGMATHSGQGDLKFVLNAAPDEFPRVVIAPGDANDCFHCAVQAFNLAEKYQLPVLLLTDKNLAAFHETVPEFEQNGIGIDRGEIVNNGNGNYLRYKDTPSGVSPRAVPGVKGAEHVASSYEHDEEGFEREDEENRVKMHRKRFRKLDSLKKEVPEPVLLGPENADVTILSWGSTKGAIREAMKLLEKDGIKANFLQIVFLSPFPAEKVKRVIESAKKTVVIEANITSQLNSLVREKCLKDVEDKILKFDGRPFFPEEIAEEIKKILKGGRE